MRKCHVRTLTVLAFTLSLGLGFQNFMAIPLEKLKLARFAPHLESAWARTQAEGDIRQIAPRRPASLDEPVIALPESGNTLESIGQDWATKQAKLLTGGREEILLKDINHSINRAFRDATTSSTGSSTASSTGSSTPVDGKTHDRSPASIDRAAVVDDSPPFFKFTSINRMQMMLANDSNLSCSVQGSGVQVDLSKTLGERVNVNLRYDTSSNSNTLRVHYTW